MADKIITKIYNELNTRDFTSFTAVELLQMLAQVMLLKQYSMIPNGLFANPIFDEETKK